ncbi:unnamed protein product [Penicillium salamii]|uniref:Protein kinase domain-containing protein n=1 Tax=Penicillium salamii TaxID=1612424 RepID=A0A9W4IDM9_9EURO|nr:unnamed protein product [Penicillium salamii]CAG8287157.1 unnamed protein product [Penicillium salamii]CAG8420026.1 unnamed protein product [Penicillium salamii]CAG8420572.1 unnamed protein product [Penicillium salamii]
MVSAMAHLQEQTSLWWPEERIKATLDAKYIVSRLQPENIPRLFELPDWGEGLTSETYMEWILLKAGRVFLILDAIGIPDRIFALVNESCDDDDLPIAEHSIDLLHLSPYGEDLALDTRFFHAQWRYLVRGIAEGEHIVYTENEGVPVEAVRTNTGSGVHGRDDTVDRVVLAGSRCRVYMRTQVQVGGAPHFFSADEVLAEIRKLRKLSHEHLISVYGSYLKEDNVCILFTGATAERSLHSFLTDEPLPFKRLLKEQRRQILITWPHCLASAVSWLHARGHSHGAIRPSNIFIDADFHICLGQFQALDSLLAPPHVNDLEAYNYSAPERWTRVPAPIAPPKPQPVQTIQASGGRTKRRQKPARLALAPLSESPRSSPDHTRPDSAASKGTVIRIGLPGSPSRFSIAFSSSSSSTASTASSGCRNPTTPDTKKHRISSLWSRRNAPPSINSSSSCTSASTSTSKSTSIPSPSSLHPQSPLSPTNTNTNSLSPNTIPLRHSISAQSLTSFSSFRSKSTPTPSPGPIPENQIPTPHPSTSPADLFSLAAITLDILTTLHKRSLQSFATHRSARNRSAGRGGGIADASFHLSRNAVQVQSWIALLEGDALKRCRRDRRSDAVFWAVPRILIAVRAMLDGEAGKRPLARRVRRCFASAVERGGGKGVLGLHCVKKGGEKVNGVEGGGNGNSDVGVSVVPSESASEFDFGFGDASGSESHVEDDEHMDEESNVDDYIQEEDEEVVVDMGVQDDGVQTESEDEHYESEYESEPDIRVQQDSPQIYLPELDVNITGIEGLTFNDFNR